MSETGMDWLKEIEDLKAENKELKEENSYVAKWMDECHEKDEKIAKLKAKLEGAEKFEKHIKAHLKDGEEVICKICGKTAKEISTLRGQSGITNQNGEPMEIVEVPVSSNSNVVSVKVDASTLREKGE